MLNTSTLLSFLDEKNNFQIRLLEGQKIISDLALIHDIKFQGFEFFRELILTNIHLISTLKKNEGLGLFIDSSKPYFRFKLECSENGSIRTLLLPQDINSFPKFINGELRFSKIFKRGSSPYTSIIQLENECTSTITNNFLKNSHQIMANVFLSERSDQSIYIAKLPTRSDYYHHEDTSELTIDSYWSQHQSFFNDLFAEGLNDSQKIITKFKNNQFTYLQSKEIELSCPCSQEQMEKGIGSLAQTEDLDHIFLDKETIEVKCDYCKSIYYIHRAKIKKEN